MRHTWILAALVAAHVALSARAEPPAQPAAEDVEAIVATAIATDAPTDAPALLGLQIDLPFDFRHDWYEESHSGGRSISAMQRIEGQVPGPSSEPARLAMVVSYRAFEGLASSELERIAQEAADKAAADAGARRVESFRVDSFPFHFIEGRIEGDGTYSERMTITGVVSGGYFRFSVFATDAAVLTAELGERMRAAKLDYAALLRLKPRFEEEARMALRDGELDTPLSRIALDARSQARMTGSLVARDASGGVIRRQRDFAIFKAGFWTLQNLVLSVSCGRDGHVGWDAEDFLHMTSELEDDDKDDRPVNVTAPSPAVMLGLPARATTAKGMRVLPGRRTDIRRWLVRDAGMAYGIGLERLNGSPVEKQLVAQLQASEPRCQLDLQFGDGGSRS